MGLDSSPVHARDRFPGVGPKAGRPSVRPRPSRPGRVPANRREGEVSASCPAPGPGRIAPAASGGIPGGPEALVPRYLRRLQLGRGKRLGQPAQGLSPEPSLRPDHAKSGLWGITVLVTLANDSFFVRSPPTGASRRGGAGGPVRPGIGRDCGAANPRGRGLWLPAQGRGWRGQGQTAQEETQLLGG